MTPILLQAVHACMLSKEFCIHYTSLVITTDSSWYAATCSLGRRTQVHRTMLCKSMHWFLRPQLLETDNAMLWQNTSMRGIACHCPCMVSASVHHAVETHVIHVLKICQMLSETWSWGYCMQTHHKGLSTILQGHQRYCIRRHQAWSQC
jgi:hypothetical protein